jgi:hypothetical protein
MSAALPENYKSEPIPAPQKKKKKSAASAG